MLPTRKVYRESCFRETKKGSRPRGGADCLILARVNSLQYSLHESPKHLEGELTLSTLVGRIEYGQICFCKPVLARNRIALLWLNLYILI